MFIAALVTTTKSGNNTKYPLVDEQTKCYIYIYNEMLIHSLKELEVMVTTMAVVLVIVVEKAMVVLDQNMVTKVVDKVAVVEDMMVTMKEEILELTMWWWKL